MAKKGFKVYDVELVLLGCLKQSLELNKHEINIK